MKDTIILEGKNYISARRAAQISGYATDYIGQLCRDGRVSSRMLGRAWFVEENELKNYSRNNPKKHAKKDLQKEPPKEQDSEQQLEPQSQTQQTPLEILKQSLPPPQTIAPTPPLHLPILETSTLSTKSDSLGDLIQRVLSEHNHAIIINQSPPTPPPVTIQQLPSSAPPQPVPLLSKIREHEPERERAPEREREVYRERNSDRENERYGERESRAPLKKVSQRTDEKFEPRKTRKKFGLGSAVAIASLVLIIISGIGSLSLFYTAPVISSAEIINQSASSSGSTSGSYNGMNTAAVAEADVGPVGATMSAIKYILYSVYTSIAHLFYKKSVSDPQLTTGSVDTGIAVVPSSKDKTKDEIIKTKLQQSFSDEVKVTSDSQGGSGIIEPVFRKETRDSFIYVTVPIKQKQQEQ